MFLVTTVLPWRYTRLKSQFFFNLYSVILFYQALILLRIFCLLLLIICLPACVLILLRKPWTRFLCLFFG
ncbi:MAG: hypothetical protein AVO34_01470 [Firmicutes bacterium ML8_F2]|nr:MAG: hypothetical protein AVO34_01470 [Firmicutes bacterium ML8_F2]